MSEEEGIILVTAEGRFWLVQGEAHMSALLSNEDEYPTPVTCVRFGTLFALQNSMPEGLMIGQLWAIHPNIIERLEKQGHIVFGEM